MMTANPKAPPGTHYLGRSVCLACNALIIARAETIYECGVNMGEGIAMHHDIDHPDLEELATVNYEVELHENGGN